MLAGRNNRESMKRDNKFCNNSTRKWSAL